MWGWERGMGKVSRHGIIRAGEGEGSMVKVNPHPRKEK